jgi:hypothetical protein
MIHHTSDARSCTSTPAHDHLTLSCAPILRKKPIDRSPVLTRAFIGSEMNLVAISDLCTGDWCHSAYIFANGYHQDCRALSTLPVLTHLLGLMPRYFSQNHLTTVTLPWQTHGVL